MGIGVIVRMSTVDGEDHHQPPPDTASAPRCAGSHESIHRSSWSLSHMTHTPLRFNKRINKMSSMIIALIGSAGVPMIGMATIAASSHTAIAQSTSSDDAETRAAKRDTLKALSKPITLDVTDQPLEDIFSFIADVTGADLEPIYLTDNVSGNGMDPATEITMKVDHTPALIVMERVLLRAQRIESTGDEYTWQFTDFGSIEMGPKLELNRNQRVELYDIADLLFVVPDFDNAPNFNLQTAVSSSSSGGGTTSPFTGGTQKVNLDSAEDRAKAITDLIQSTIEPDQWAGLGGDGASMTSYGTSLVITAPDYIHRQIAGYSFWPARLQQVRKVDGKQKMIIKPETRKNKKP